MNDIIANRRHVVSIQRALEGHHARILQGSVQHDLVPKGVTEKVGGTQIRKDAAADCIRSLADTALAAETSFTVRNRSRGGGLGRRLDDQLAGLERRQGSRTTDLEG